MNGGMWDGTKGMEPAIALLYGQDVCIHYTDTDGQETRTVGCLIPARYASGAINDAWYQLDWGYAVLKENVRSIHRANQHC